MSIFERFLGFVVAVLLIVACYQIYLFPQKRSFFTERSLACWCDSIIPFRPKWVWIYIFAYYPFLISLVALVPNWKMYFFVTGSFLGMLALQVTIAIIFPVRVPTTWRCDTETITPSVRLLRFVQTIDRGGNCFPSMHVAVAVLSAAFIDELLAATGIFQP